MNSRTAFAFSMPDLQSGCEAIARFSLANPQQAEIDVNRFLDSLLNAPPDGKTYFRLLEQARVAIGFVAEAQAKAYLNKPLPFNDGEEKRFQAVVALWLKTARAYAHSAEKDSCQAADLNHSRRVAMILHRCIHYTGMAIVEHQRARRELPWGLWLDLHGYFASAEEWGVAALAIPDAVEARGRGTHCTASYISFLLGEMAFRGGLSLREQTLVRRWTVDWSPLVTLHKVEPGHGLPEYIVDPMHDVALRPARDCRHGDIRRLDTERLLMQISQTRQQLKQKVSPAQLALGDECTAAQCNRLLERLSRRWSQAHAERKFQRRSASGSARVCSGFDEMHYFISGKEFEQPDNVRAYSRRERESVYALRQQSDPQHVFEVGQQQRAYAIDIWEAVNESANGFRLARRSVGQKIAHGQLLALCPHDSERFLLAQTRWLMQEKDGGLSGGMRALPGMPAAVAARPLNQNGIAGGKFHRAFLLPKVPAVDAEPSVVMPHGWFRAGRILELSTDGVCQIQLRRLLEDGLDYQRVSFTVC